MDMIVSLPITGSRDDSAVACVGTAVDNEKATAPAPKALLNEKAATERRQMERKKAKSMQRFGTMTFWNSNRWIFGVE